MTQMKENVFHSIIWKEDDLYIARALEVNVASQGESQKEATKNLKEALELYLEDSKEALPVVQSVEIAEVSV